MKPAGGSLTLGILFYSSACLTLAIIYLGKINTIENVIKIYIILFVIIMLAVNMRERYGPQQLSFISLFTYISILFLIPVEPYIGGILSVTAAAIITLKSETYSSKPLYSPINIIPSILLSLIILIFDIFLINHLSPNQLRQCLLIPIIGIPSFIVLFIEPRYLTPLHTFILFSLFILNSHLNGSPLITILLYTHTPILYILIFVSTLKKPH